MNGDVSRFPGFDLDGDVALVSGAAGGLGRRSRAGSPGPEPTSFWQTYRRRGWTPCSSESGAWGRRRAFSERTLPGRMTSRPQSR